MEKKPTKKTLKLEKETLIRLQEDQMKALIGAENMTTDSGAACDNTVDVPINLTKSPKAGLGLALEKSCCRRSC